MTVGMGKVCFKLFFANIPEHTNYYYFKSLFHVHWRSACMCVYVRMSEPLELELQTVVGCHVGAEN